MNFATFSLNEKWPIEILTIEHEMLITNEFLFMEHDAHLSGECLQKSLRNNDALFSFY